MESNKIDFGVDHLATDTPKPVKNVYRTIMFLCGFWAICVEPRFPNIPEHIVHEIDNWMLALNTFIYFICQFFGWKVPSANNEA